MSEGVIVHYLNQRQPPLEGTLSTDGTGDPLPASATVKFQMRAVGSATLKVDATASVVSEPNNTVIYQWAAVDVDTAGFYVGWWKVTISGQTEDTPEFPIWIRPHAPLTPQYVSAEELKNSLSLTGESYADADIDMALQTASSVIDETCGGSFTPVTTTRLFSPVSAYYIRTGPISTITALSSSGSAFTENTHYYIDGGDTLRTLQGNRFAVGAQLVSVSATFGTLTVPPEIKSATALLAQQFLRRSREAAFPILAIGLDGQAIRMGRFDPHIEQALAKWKVTPMIE